MFVPKETPGLCLSWLCAFSFSSLTNSNSFESLNLFGLHKLVHFIPMGHSGHYGFDY